MTTGTDPVPPADAPVGLVRSAVLPPKPNDPPVAPVEPVEPDTVVLAPPEADTPPDAEDPPVVPVAEPVVDDPECEVADPADDPAVDEDELDEVDELDELEPLEPPEPLGSAKATTGTDAIAAPTPRATASAPTRPT